MFSLKTKRNDAYEWTPRELQEFLLIVVQGLQQHAVVCFIDALDECNEDEMRELIEFLEDVGENSVSSGTSLNMCISTRYYPNVRMRKGVQLNLDDQEGHENDIAAYIDSKLDVPHTPQIDEIKAELRNRAREIFLWVFLVVRMVNRAYDSGKMHAVEKLLREVPNELDDLFANILERDPESKKLSTLCLQWIFFAKRPLKREELYFALLSGTEPSALKEWNQTDITYQIIDNFILDCSKGLAQISKAKDKAVQFIHESVRDFLVQEKGPGFVRLQPDLTGNVNGESEDQLKICCHQYLSSGMLRELSCSNSLPNASRRRQKVYKRLLVNDFRFLTMLFEIYLATLMPPRAIMSVRVYS
jgi:hypothetical protein